MDFFGSFQRSHEHERDHAPEGRSSRSSRYSASRHERRQARSRQVAQRSRRKRTATTDYVFILILLALVGLRVFPTFLPDRIALSLSRPSYRIPLHDEDMSLLSGFDARARSLSLEIFSSPKPFVGPDKEANERAIESWLRLRPQPRITLLGSEEGYFEAAEKYNIHVDSRVDKTFKGLPLFNSMIHRANQSSESVSVLVNGDILLFDDFVQTLRKTAASFRDFLVVAARYDVDALPNESEAHLGSIRNHVVSTGRLHTYGGMDVWAWNTDGPPLFKFEMPHFVFGRGKYDNWMTHEAIAAGNRQVVDASETCLLVHLKHDYHLVAGNDGSVQHGNQPARRRLLAKQFWSEGKNTKFELFVNIYLSMRVGSYKNQLGSVLYAPWKLSRCAEPLGMCLSRRKRPGVCPCEYSSTSLATQTDPKVLEGSRIQQCGMVSEEKKESFEIPVRQTNEGVEPAAFGLPLTIESISSTVAENGTLFVTALTHGYRSIMMNWVCNLRELGIRNYVVAALDEDLYKYNFVRGIPTYYESTVHPDALPHESKYGSTSFKQITKAKSKVVLRFLKLGFNVVWCDSDIVLFKNPIGHMWSVPGDIVIQSNAPDNEPANGIRRINSGFYLAKSTREVIEAFTEIVRYGEQSSMSEQPCFYDVLCGKDGSRAVGSNACRYGKLTITLLDRNLYPNGITRAIWETPDGEIPATYPELYILHNNWVKGADMKMSRFLRHHFVTYDSTKELCTYDSVVYHKQREQRSALG